MLRGGSVGGADVVDVRKAIRLRERLPERASSKWRAHDTYGEAGLALVGGLFLGGLREGLEEGLKERG